MRKMPINFYVYQDSLDNNGVKNTFLLYKKKLKSFSLILAG